jgi:3-phenylpropionate/cinnamic acid dioxygenase small subunit
VDGVTGGRPWGAVDVALQADIEQFLYHEAELLDEHRFGEWFELFADDVRYRVPTQANRLRRDRRDGREAVAGAEAGGAEPRDDPGDGSRIEVALFDDDKTTLGWRVRQLESSTHWAEDPPSRTRHLVTNVRIRPSAREGHHDGLLAVRSNFICYRNRLAGEVDIWAGERHDLLRPTGTGWLVARRTVLLDQNVVLSKNLSVFL